MRISDWSSDVCSSDLLSGTTVYPLAAVQSASDPTRIALAYSLPAGAGSIVQVELADSEVNGGKLAGFLQFRRESMDAAQDQDRKSVVSGKSVSVRVDLGGSGLLKKKKRNNTK